VVGQRLFVIPLNKANEIDPATGQRCVFVQVNGVRFHIPVDKPTPIPYNAFCVLRDIGFMEKYMNYDEGEGFKSL
jgi:hypothetical protein